MIAEQDWERAIGLLSGATHVALACHMEPDGDALGATLALARHLQQRGVATTCAFGLGEGGSSEVPPQYTFLPGAEDLVPAAAFPADPEVLVVLDCAAASRLGRLEASVRGAGTVLVVDHHASGTPFGDVRLIDPEAAATVVLVEELIRRAGGALDRTIATCLYTGLVTDTGRFAFSSVTPAVMQLGARLLDHQIDHAAINRQVWDSHSLGYLKLLGRTCERATFLPEAGLAWTAVYRSDLDELDLAPGELEGLVDVLRGLECADTTLIARELAGDTAAPLWKLSLRSRGGVDVGRVCQRLGGGGHAFAAGCTVRAPLDDIVGRVSALLTGQAADPALVG